MDIQSYRNRWLILVNWSELMGAGVQLSLVPVVVPSKDAFASESHKRSEVVKTGYAS